MTLVSVRIGKLSACGWGVEIQHLPEKRERWRAEGTGEKRARRRVRSAPLFWLQSSELRAGVDGFAFFRIASEPSQNALPTFGVAGCGRGTGGEAFAADFYQSAGPRRAEGRSEVLRGRCLTRWYNVSMTCQITTVSTKGQFVIP